MSLLKTLTDFTGCSIAFIVKFDLAISFFNPFHARIAFLNALKMFLGDIGMGYWFEID